MALGSISLAAAGGVVADVVAGPAGCCAHAGPLLATIGSNAAAASTAPARLIARPRVT